MATYKDMTGKIIGNFTVLFKLDEKKHGSYLYQVQCACGKIVHLPGKRIKVYKSCGCIQDISRRKKKHDDLQKKYGCLSVLSTQSIFKDGIKYIKCKCDCGTVCLKNYSSLKHGLVKYCDRTCVFKYNLMGKTFGYLTVIKYIGREGSQRVWKCICKCGNYTESTTNSLKRGSKVSCNCKLKENAMSWYHSEKLIYRRCRWCDKRIETHNMNKIYCGNNCGFQYRRLSRRQEILNLISDRIEQSM